MHDGGQFNITSHICNLKNRVKEFVLASKQSKDLESSKVTSWKRPSVGVIKLKVDAAVQNNYTTLAAVAHNDVGMVIKGWAKY